MSGSWWYQAIRVNRDFHRLSLVNRYIDENIKSTDSFIGRKENVVYLFCLLVVLMLYMCVYMVLFVFL